MREKFWPKNLREANAYRYNRWAGNPDGDEYRNCYCAAEVIEGFEYRQCSRKDGHGPQHHYCRQHAKIYYKLEGE